MFKPAKPFFFFIPIFLSLAFSLSRDLPHPTKTTLLDVSFSLQQALNIISFDPLKQTSTTTFSQQAETTNPSFLNSSSFSLTLHSRDSIRKTHHTDYKSLVLSRLNRDISRVKAINTRLELILNGVSRSDLKPVQTEIQAEDLSTPVSSGISQGSGEYFSRVGVGNPVKPYYMVIDTGSDVNWIQCQPCSDCYQQTDPIYAPSASSTYKPLTCASPECNSLQMSSCRNGQCLYQVNYGDGSFTFGDFVTETVSFGRSGVVDNIAIGCGHDNEGLFVGAAGLLGLGGGPLSFTSQLKATSFSYCLVNRDSTGSSTLDFNSGPVGDSAFAPLFKSNKIDTFYYFGLTGISVGGHLLSIPEEVFKLDEAGDGGVIVDCGTAITRLQSQAYNSLRDSFVSLTRNLRSTSGVALFDTCYDLSGQTSVKVPTVSFHLAGDKEWNLPAENYLIPVDSSGTYCLAFAPTTSSLSIIGNVQQQGSRISFDLGNNRVGFSPRKC